MRKQRGRITYPRRNSWFAECHESHQATELQSPGTGPCSPQPQRAEESLESLNIKAQHCPPAKVVAKTPFYGLTGFQWPNSTSVRACVHVCTCVQHKYLLSTFMHLGATWDTEMGKMCACLLSELKQSHRKACGLTFAN